jgi:hypothetical protein
MGAYYTPRAFLCFSLKEGLIGTFKSRSNALPQLINAVQGSGEDSGIRSPLGQRAPL